MGGKRGAGEAFWQKTIRGEKNARGSEAAACILFSARMEKRSKIYGEQQQQQRAV
jgi:hypothetical protein